MTRWDKRYRYRAKKPAHRWRLIAPGAWQCRICDVHRRWVKWLIGEGRTTERLGEYMVPGGNWVPSTHVPPCAGVQ